MSLTVSAKTSGGMEPIPGGTYLAVCNTLIDLGDQYNEQYGKTQRKVLIGWELPDETYEKDGETRCRQISSRYTASLDNRGKLKPDLESWRGRVFTQEELAGFDLKNIVGANCMLNIIRDEYNGKTFSKVKAITPLPKGMPKAMLSAPATVIDLDTASLDDIDELPTWIADIIKQSTTYKEMVDRDMLGEAAPVETEIAELPGEDEEGLPF